MKEDVQLQRVIQEYVPGKQVSLAHVIVNPDESIYRKLGLEVGSNSIGILTITPSEGAIIAADIAMKAGEIDIGYIDRFNGSLVIVGDVASVEASILEVLERMKTLHGMSVPQMTRT